MLQRIRGSQRSPLVHYGVLAVLLAILFFLGYRVGLLLLTGGTQSAEPQNVAAPMSNGAALVQPPLQLSDFTLTNQEGKPVSLSDLRGKPLLLFFGYTHCPDECPTTLANFARVKQALGTQAEQVQFAFVSVDPQRDSPPVLAEYLDHFDDSFIGLTGDLSTLQQLGAQFGLAFDKVILGDDGSVQPASDATENYFMSHTSPVFMIDAEGKLNRLFFYGTAPDVIANNLRDFTST